MSQPLLDYSVATDPFPLPASPGTGNLVSCVLQVIGSNPSPDPDRNPVAIQGIRITIPVGPGGSALTDDVANIGPVPPAGWKQLPNTPAGVYSFVPASGTAQVGSDSLVFTFNAVYVNRQPGYVQGLEVVEGSKGCRPPNCPTAPLALTKFPAGWGAVVFWVDPPDIPAGQATHLHWSGPQGAAYTIEYVSGTRVVNIPAAGAPPLANAGVYPGTGDPPLQPSTTTVFTLTVTDTINGVQYTAQDQKTVTVQEPPPTISLFTGAVSFDPGTGACTLTFNWQTDADHCSLTGVQEQLNPSSTAPGLAVPLTNPGAESYTLTAINSVGKAQSTLSLQWGVTSQVPNLPGPRPGAAVSHDGTLLYVAGGNTFAVYGRPVVPGTAPTQLRSGTVGFSGDGFQAVAPQPDGSRIWAYAETAPGSFAIFMVMDGNPPKPSGGPTSAPGYGVLFYLGMAPAGNVLYFANGDAGDVYGFEVTALHQLVQLGSVNTGMQAACGAAVAPNGDVYSATTISAIRYAPGPRSGNPILTEQGRRQITQGWDGNEMQGLAFGGGVLWVLTTNFAVPCDPVSLTPLRDPIPMTHSGIACSADGLRLYVVDWNTGPALYEYAPTTMSGGVAGHGGDES